MQVNLDKKTSALLSIILLLAGALIFVLSSRENKDAFEVHNHMSGSVSNSAFTGADVMFLQMMIPHHQQAINMSNLALELSKNKELLELAKVIAKDQAAEIIQMRNWLKRAGASEDPGHSMSGMGGMLTPEEYSKLEKSSGIEFDKLWLEGMTEHHDGAIHMTNMIIDADNSEIKAFGEAIVKAQSAQIEQMKSMLAKL